MTGSERPSPEPLLKKEASPAVLGGDNSGNALEASNALQGRTFFRNVPVTPTPSIFPKVLPHKWGAYCRTNGRRTAVQMGGVLRGFPFFEA